MSKEQRFYDSGKLIVCKDTGERVARKDYLQSTHWKTLRGRIYDKYEGKCQRCGDKLSSSLMHVHHKTYKRMGNEDENDLILYCNSCHAIIHKSFKREVNDIKAINKELNLYIRELDSKQKEDALTILKWLFPLDL